MRQLIMIYAGIGGLTRLFFHNRLDSLQFFPVSFRVAPRFEQRRQTERL